MAIDVAAVCPLAAGSGKGQRFKETRSARPDRAGTSRFNQSAMAGWIVIAWENRSTSSTVLFRAVALERIVIDRPLGDTVPPIRVLLALASGCSRLPCAVDCGAVVRAATIARAAALDRPS